MNTVHGVLPLLFGGAVLQPFSPDAQSRSAHGGRMRRCAQASLCILKSCFQACESSADMHKLSVGSPPGTSAWSLLAEAFHAYPVAKLKL